MIPDFLSIFGKIVCKPRRKSHIPGLRIASLGLRLDWQFLRSPGNVKLFLLGIQYTISRYFCCQGEIVNDIESGSLRSRGAPFVPRRDSIRPALSDYFIFVKSTAEAQ